MAFKIKQSSPNSKQKQNKIQKLPLTELALVIIPLKSTMQEYLLCMKIQVSVMLYNNYCFGWFFQNSAPNEFDIMIFPDNVDVAIEWNDTMPKGFCKLRLESTSREELRTEGYLDPSKFKKMAFAVFGEAACSRHVKRNNIIPCISAFNGLL